REHQVLQEHQELPVLLVPPARRVPPVHLELLIRQVVPMCQELPEHPELLGHRVPTEQLVLFGIIVPGYRCLPATKNETSDKRSVI
ncbi:MAG TPA: hypothetical protein PKM59_02280, partial [Thermodesulfobacteriota bacterium]|nr:hypothetical protein [Thermodesulfobacteriota bacterium]